MLQCGHLTQLWDQRTELPNLLLGVGGEGHSGGQATGRRRNYCQAFEQRTHQRENTKTERTEIRMWQFSELQVVGFV